MRSRSVRALAYRVAEGRHIALTATLTKSIYLRAIPVQGRAKRIHPATLTRYARARTLCERIKSQLQ